MRNYIIADNQELTAYALQSLLKRDEGSAVFRAVDKSGLTELLKEHEDAVVFLDYTLFDFADEDQLLIVAERFSLSEWILISDELTPQFVRRVVYSSHQLLRKRRSSKPSPRGRPPRRLLPNVSRASTLSRLTARISSENWASTPPTKP